MPDTERFQSTPSLRRATAIIIEGPLRLQVSIHALLAESDPAAPSLGAAVNVFQSTPSLRRATYGVRVGPVVGDVSIHALLAESDDQLVLAPANCSLFQSTPSLRRATRPCQDVVHLTGCFNPRPPCGERHMPLAALNKGMAFQSTPSLRRATGRLRKNRPFLRVSIHALLAESDPSSAPWTAKSFGFNPRPPCGERLIFRIRR